ncbi:alanine racemase [Staphylococcus felis]|uniref:Alanine racemase n=1 Tax=Staphylococcus felis TaxID=46127 RepID=A0AAX1RYF4_9STAP|nr:alanine racemase [Staphylococcus felis]MDM8327338.1 alanine racemase [Staphylococcus felis]REH78847.1 alanine racemase [Staphylococcus felis]REH79488.1 alanine racemase [Staphylococcus felis]REH81081.1 alanine racemase [Staphylococcus felis]REH85857.1 alanine racemase [Staphylococcus felis]
MVATWQVDTTIFQNNIRQVVGNQKIMAVVKNNAYNYGLEFAVRQFLEAGIEAFSTTSLDEAIKVKRIAPNAVVFLMNATTHFEKLRQYGIHMTLPSLLFYHRYSDELYDIHVHIEYENLLHRSGFKSLDEIKHVLNEHSDNQNSKMKITGLWTHFGYADEFECSEYETERYDWLNIVESLYEEGYRFEMIHSQNSASYFREGHLLERHTHARVGIALYGSRPYSNLERDAISQSLVLKANVIQVRTVHKGEHCGYSFAYTAVQNNTKLAVVDIGYGDGILRSRSKHEVMINERIYPIRALMMSHMFVEVDEYVSPGDEVIIYNETLRIDDYTFKGVGANSEQLSALNLDSLKKEYLS